MRRPWDSGGGYTPFNPRTAAEVQEVAYASDDDFNVQREESMEISNDPRFFTDSILDKRLAAFASLVVASTLMLENSADIGFEMQKHMSFDSIEGALQFLAFFILMCILLANVVSVYVGVAQPYHSLRLLTSGPAGFEASASYYLHKDITVYRHFAVKCMLLSIPWFVLANGLRMMPKFVRDAALDKKHKGGGHEPGHKMFAWLHHVSALTLHLESGLFVLLFGLAAICVWCLHLQHIAIFQENYGRVWHSGMNMLIPQVRSSMHRRSNTRQSGPLDV